MDPINSNRCFGRNCKVEITNFDLYDLNRRRYEKYKKFEVKYLQSHINYFNTNTKIELLSYHQSLKLTNNLNYAIRGRLSFTNKIHPECRDKPHEKFINKLIYLRDLYLTHMSTLVIESVEEEEEESEEESEEEEIKIITIPKAIKISKKEIKEPILDTFFEEASREAEFNVVESYDFLVEIVRDYLADFIINDDIESIPPARLAAVLSVISKINSIILTTENKVKFKEEIKLRLKELNWDNLITDFNVFEERVKISNAFYLTDTDLTLTRRSAEKVWKKNVLFAFSNSRRQKFTLMAPSSRASMLKYCKGNDYFSIRNRTLYKSKHRHQDIKEFRNKFFLSYVLNNLGFSNFLGAYRENDPASFSPPLRYQNVALYVVYNAFYSDKFDTNMRIPCYYNVIFEELANFSREIVSLSETPSEYTFSLTESKVIPVTIFPRMYFKPSEFNSSLRSSDVKVFSQTLTLYWDIIVLGKYIKISDPKAEIVLNMTIDRVAISLSYHHANKANFIYYQNYKTLLNMALKYLNNPLNVDIIYQDYLNFVGNFNPSYLDSSMIQELNKCSYDTIDFKMVEVYCFLNSRNFVDPNTLMIPSPGTQLMLNDVNLITKEISLSLYPIINNTKDVKQYFRVYPHF